VKSERDHLDRVRAINQRWLATEGLDDETLALRARVSELRARFPKRPPWWRPYARRQWDQTFRAVCEWAYERYNWPTVEPYR
jgi:hypothetical protein